MSRIVLVLRKLICILWWNIIGCCRFSPVIQEEVSYIFVSCVIGAPTLDKLKGVKSHLYDDWGVFSKEEARIKKRKMP